MNTSRIAALKILLIIEEHKPAEIRRAVEILRESGRSGILLDYFADEKRLVPNVDQRSEKHSAGKLQPAHSEQRSRALSKIEESEPEKFTLLSEFETLIKSGKILNTNEAIRRIGEYASKTFVGKKTRKESIISLFDVLAEADIEKIRDIIKYSISDLENRRDDEYYRLAEFLIKGRA